MQFSLDRKRRSLKQNRCSASDFVGLIFTRSYRSTFLITTPTTTPSLVKTALRGYGTLKYGDVHEKFNFLEIQDLRPLRTCQKHFENDLAEFSSR